MSIAKPFTFVANTYAKASEVNANFDTVYSQVNTNISGIAQNATDIDNLENNKADINGNSAQRFAVADAITNGDAINKQTLYRAISNSLDYISGLVIVKDSGSPDDTILVSAGSCYDSGNTVILALSDSISKQNLNQGASTTYYVYIIGNNSGSNVDILISSNSTTPALPAGYTKYRLIGYYTTDSNSKMDTVYPYGNDNSTIAIAKVVADYHNGGSGYRIWSDGFKECWGYMKPVNNTTYYFPNTGENAFTDASTINFTFASRSSTGWDGGGASYTYEIISFESVTTTSFVAKSIMEPYLNWRASGY